MAIDETSWGRHGGERSRSRRWAAAAL